MCAISERLYKHMWNRSFFIDFAMGDCYTRDGEKNLVECLYDDAGLVRSKVVFHAER